MSTPKAYAGTSLERLIQTIQELNISGDMAEIKIRFPDLVQRILTVGNAGKFHGVHDASNLQVDSVLQELNMAELGLAIDKQNAIVLGNSLAYDALAETFHDGDNKGILGYDRSPEVIKKGEDLSAQFHRQFIATHASHT